MIRASRVPPASSLDSNRLLAFSGFLKGSTREFQTIVRGASMGAALPDGSRIRVRFASSYFSGDVVAYVAERRVVAHRLLRCITSPAGRYLITRGDATALCDPPVPVSSVIGIVTHVESAQQWKAVPPPRDRPLGFRLRAALLARTIALIARIFPRAAKWIVLRLISLRALRSRDPVRCGAPHLPVSGRCGSHMPKEPS